MLKRKKDKDTKNRSKRFCIDYIGSRKLGEVSYNELYDYLTNEKKVYLPHAGSEPHSNELLELLPDLCLINLIHYTNPNIADVQTEAEYIARLPEYKIQWLDKKLPVLDSVHDTYNIETRIAHSENLSKWSFIIAILAFTISLAQLVIDVNDIHFGKDKIFERTTMHNDSMQVSQNQILIALLKEQNKRLEIIENNKPDTIIISIPKKK